METIPSEARTDRHGAGKRALRWVIVAAIAVAAAGFLFGFRNVSGPEREFSGPGAVMHVLAPTEPVSVGSFAAAEVRLDAAGYDVTAADISVSFNRKVLEVTGIEVLPGFTKLSGGTAQDGVAAIVVGSGTKPVPGGGALVRITFRALKAGTASVALGGTTQAAAAGHPSDIIRELRSAEIIVR